MIETTGNPVIMGNDGMFSGGCGFWGFLILAMFLFGGNGWGGNNNGNSNAIQNDINRGFDTQNLQNQTRDILTAVTSGTAQSVAATNQTFHDTWSMISDKYSELARDIATVNVGQANILAKQNECCCSILRSIDGVNYNNAINTAAIQKTIMEDGQKTRDLITTNKIEALQNEVNQLKLAQQMQGVVRYPNVMAYNAGTSPFCNNNGCGGC
jgi:hypothetical protein